MPYLSHRVPVSPTNELTGGPLRPFAPPTRPLKDGIRVALVVKDLALRRGEAT
jgi:hypothetical protein